jgi:hypothetical protein
MKNKFNVLMGIACMFAFTASHAQLPSVMTNAAVSTEIEGTPYLDEKFVPAVIYHDNTLHKVPVRYNMFRDVIEYMEGTVNMSLEPGPNINKVRFGANTFVVQKFEYKRQTKYGYLALLDSGKVMLYSKKVVTFHKASKEPPPTFREIPAGYDRGPDVFYYKIGDGELHEVESIKSMIATLPEKQEELTVFAKKEKISPKKEEKIIKFVQYYNSL